MIVHVFKCPQCDKEFRVSKNDAALINEAVIEAPQHCGGYCQEDRIEVVDVTGPRSWTLSITWGQ